MCAIARSRRAQHADFSAKLYDAAFRNGRGVIPRSLGEDDEMPYTCEGSNYVFDRGLNVFRCIKNQCSDLVT